MTDDLTLADLLPDPQNRRKRTPRNVEMITTALREVGAGRSIVIDERHEVLAGNGVVEAAQALGFSKVQVVKGDRDTLVAIQRDDLTPDETRRLALYDNRTGELAEWNWQQIATDEAAGLELAPFFTEAELAEGISSLTVPEFAPVSPEDQSRLDQMKLLKCPNCGHEFRR
jgi:ParB-like chromosome segregation protein Spo0J